MPYKQDILIKTIWISAISSRYKHQVHNALRWSWFWLFCLKEWFHILIDLILIGSWICSRFDIKQPTLTNITQSAPHCPGGGTSIKDKSCASYFFIFFFQVQPLQISLNLKCTLDQPSNQAPDSPFFFTWNRNFFL